MTESGVAQVFLSVIEVGGAQLRFFFYQNIRKVAEQALAAAPESRREWPLGYVREVRI